MNMHHSSRELFQGRPFQAGFSAGRTIFSDPVIFDQEMRDIFESTWVCLGVAAQAPRPDDFFTSWIGRQPVIVTRGSDGTLRCFLNTCPHRGAALTQLRSGSTPRHICPYHGWGFDSSGTCRGIKAQKEGCYPPEFDQQSHDLIAVPRFGEYRGFLFASLNAGVSPLEKYLGETTKLLDLIVDQSEHGMEVIPGRSSFIYRGNWKLQLENGLDLYHLDATHVSLIKIVSKRQSGESENKLPSKNLGDYRKPGVVRGSYTFKHGHALVWGTNPVPSDRPLYETLDEVRKRVGDVKAEWMLATRNLTLFPNVQITESASLLLRMIRPIAVDQTEVTTYCLGMVGESEAMRERRLRQFEDFFTATGLATSDDNAVYEECQHGLRGGAPGGQQGYARGMTALIHGPDEHAKALGLVPATSVSGAFGIQDETVFHALYAEWRRLMRA